MLELERELPLLEQPVMASAVKVHSDTAKVTLFIIVILVVKNLKDCTQSAARVTEVWPVLPAFYAR